MASSSKEEISRRIASYPKNALNFFSGGFAVAAALSEPRRAEVLNAVLSNLDRGMRLVDGKVLASFSDLNEREAEQLASVYSLVAGLLAESEATASDFVEVARGVLFPPEQEPIARSIAEAVCASRPEIDQVVRRAQLQGEVLPSLDAINIAIDVRVRVVNDAVRDFVPVAVLHIATDVSGQQMWLQLTRADIEETVDKLKKCLQDMQIASIAMSGKR